MAAVGSPQRLLRSSGWSWANGYDNASVYLGNGRHTIKVRSLTAAMTIDRVAIVPSGSTEIVAGMVTIGPQETGSGEQPEHEKPYTFKDWETDATRNNNRVVLVELENSTGTTYLATKPFLCSNNNAHDGWLKNAPLMRFSLTSLVDGIGNLSAYIPEGVPDVWIGKEWRGYRCRFYYGDDTWRREDFRLIAGATIEDIKTTGYREYQFELVGDVENYASTYHSSTVTQSLTVGDAIEWICSQGGKEKPLFLNLDDGELDRRVVFEVTDSSTMYADIKAIAAEVGAYPRPSQTGGLEIIKPDKRGEPTLTLGNGDVRRGSVSEVEVEVESAVKKVVLTYGASNTRIEKETTAKTGNKNESIVVESLLQNSPDANARLDELAVQYSTAGRSYSLDVFHSTSILREGDFIYIDCDELTGAAVIETIEPSFDSAQGTIEVRV